MINHKIKKLKGLASEFIETFKKDPRNIKLLAIDLEKMEILFDVEHEQSDILNKLYHQIIVDSGIFNTQIIHELDN